MAWHWNREPFGAGNPTAQAGFEFNPRFPGQYADSETGTNYNYFRDYDPATGRYVESDPIGLRGGTNTFGYANGNPLKFADPTGELFFVLPIIEVCFEAPWLCAAPLIPILV